MSKRDWTPVVARMSVTEEWHIYPAPPHVNQHTPVMSDVLHGEDYAKRLEACYNALTGIEDPSVVGEMVALLRPFANHAAGSHHREMARALLRRIDGEK